MMHYQTHIHDPFMDIALRQPGLSDALDCSRRREWCDESGRLGDICAWVWVLCMLNAKVGKCLFEALVAHQVGYSGSTVVV